MQELRQQALALQLRQQAWGAVAWEDGVIQRQLLAELDVVKGPVGR